MVATLGTLVVTPPTTAVQNAPNTTAAATAAATSASKTATNTTSAATTTTASTSSASSTSASTAPNKVLIIWQKSTISSACQTALATVESGVHIWSPTIDGQKLDAPTFANASYGCLILWAGDPSSSTAAADVHTWVTNNRTYLKANPNIVCYVVPTKIFSVAGLKSVYEDFATAIKALPKWSDDLHNLLLNFEAQFPTSEVSTITALLQKVYSFFTKNA